MQTCSIETASNHMDDISAKYNTNDSCVGSSNPGKARGLFSLFGNFVPERLTYNVGWIEYQIGWDYYQDPRDQAKPSGESLFLRKIFRKSLARKIGKNYATTNRLLILSPPQARIDSLSQIHK
jgi:hypothetical protein